MTDAARITFGSICSGIGAAEVAWEPLGWRCAFVSEIDKFPRAVLAHRLGAGSGNGPKLFGDFTRITRADVDEPIDLLVGGTPCQSFSVAGRRLGLDDPRGNLALEYLALARRLRPRWLVFENVPGLLSSDEWRDFGTFLGLMGECGYGFAYRVLDAQYAGVPQRRRRPFVVGYLGDWRRAAAVLLEPESLRGDCPPRRQAGEGIAPTVASRPTGGGGLGTDFDCDGGLIAIQERALCENADAGPDGVGIRTDGVSYTLESRSVPQAVAFQSRIARNGRGQPSEIVPTLNGADAGATSDMRPLVAFAIGSHAGAADGDQTNRSHNSGGPVGSNISEEMAYSLRGGRTQSVASGYAVRRLTPRECERLQGFPDDWTLIPYNGKPAKDGPRYKAIGNAMAVPVMRWIGERIALVDTGCATQGPDHRHEGQA